LLLALNSYTGVENVTSLSYLDAKTNVTVVVTDGDESLEPGPLTGAGLLLDGHDLQNLVLEGGAQEEVDDLKLLRKDALSW
jgi:hypothetical protein